jgi:hypothetical protein
VVYIRELDYAKAFEGFWQAAQVYRLSLNGEHVRLCERGAGDMRDACGQRTQRRRRGNNVGCEMRATSALSPSRGCRHACQYL